MWIVLKVFKLLIYRKIEIDTGLEQMLHTLLLPASSHLILFVYCSIDLKEISCTLIEINLLAKVRNFKMQYHGTI